MRNRLLLFLSMISLAFIATACGSPYTLPTGPTPIPTLIPVTSPASILEPTPTPQLVVESFTARLPAADAGRLIYEQHCAQCHGTDGKGLVPNARNFSDLDYMRGASPVEFYLAVTEGRGNEMPSFADVLTSDERWDVVFFVWRFSTDTDRLAIGQQVYAKYCVSCHGEDGRSMILGAANLSDPRFLSNRSPSELYVVVTQGKGSMPAWQARLSQDERWAVLDYVRTFTYNPALTGEVVLQPTPEQAEAVRPECTPYLDQTNPFDWNDAQAITAGEAIFSNCAGCHGQDGTGLISGVPDFTAPAYQAELRENPNHDLCSIAEGLNAMPSWKATLSIEQIWQVLTFIASLGK